MATIERTVELIFAGKDLITPALGPISTALKTLDAEIQAIADPLAKVFDFIVKVDAALAGLAIGGLAVSLTQFREFEDAQLELSKVLDENNTGLEEARNFAFELSNQYGISASDILRATADFVQAGKTVEEAFDLMRVSIEAAIATELDVGQVSTTLISVLAGFRLPITEARNLFDSINSVSQAYGVTVGQLVDGLREVAPIARQMGLSFEETLGILTPVIEVFQSGSEAGTALRTGLLRLIDDSKPVQDALADLGVSQRDLNKNLRSGKDILFDVANAFQTAEQSDKGFLTQQLVGINQSAKLTEVFDGLGKALEATAVATERNATISDEANKRLETFGIQADRVKVSFANLATIIGEQFAESAGEALSGVTAIENTLFDLVRSGAFDDLVQIINETFGDLGDFLQGVAEALPEAVGDLDFTPITDELTQLREEFTIAFGALDLTKPEDLRVALQRIIDAIGAFITSTQGIVQVIGEAVDRGIIVVDKIIDLDDKFKVLLGRAAATGKILQSFGSLLGVPLAGLADDFARTLIPGGQFVGLLQTLVGGMTSTADAANSMSPKIQQLDADFAGINAEIDTTAEKVDEIGAGFTQGQTDIQGFTNVVGGFDQILKNMGIQADASRIHIENLGDSTGDASKQFGDIIQNAQGVYTNVGTIAKTIPDVTGGMEQLRRQTEATGSKLQGAEKDTEDFRLALARIQADLTAKKYELLVDVRTAQIQADARVVEAALESIGTTIESTGDAITSLFSLLSDALGQGQTALANQIQAQIDRERFLRERAAQDQHQLIQAQIDTINLRNQILQQGGALIQIDSTGLEPALEQVMWSILEKVQLRVNASAADFLIGIP